MRLTPNPLVLLLVTIVGIVAVFSRCSGPALRTGNMPIPDAPGGGAVRKVEGAVVDRLSSSQLQSIVQTCFRFSNLDDGRVPYTRSYCERAMTERDLRSLNEKSSAPVNPRVDALH